MTTKQLTYAAELARTQNFNRAAENLFISQPTLTYQIKLLEDEIGFEIFARSGKGATLTPAGEQFIVTIRSVLTELNKAIENGQNFSSKYKGNINICMPVRSALYFLPQIIMEFAKLYPDISVTPYFIYSGYLERFFAGEMDVTFSLEHNMKRIHDVKKHHLFDSGIYLICKKNDMLSRKRIIRESDLSGRTLMIGNTSPPELKSVQQRLISGGNISYFNSPDHNTTLTNVASERGICLSPGFLNDHTGEFVWIPYDCKEKMPCAIYTHRSESRKFVLDFVKLVQQTYEGSGLKV
ncbi:LysR family transcriptional regulator [Ruminococcus sp.]|uniref:LysR family transcriptional regulator n=1 Tax=Ruminococcus sp. TaxID=41978 RepID=UPI0026000C06|nr:LysR family transcriptional regulator [Ruminococcus sp.]MBQ8967601.1 LysR family transcriptional regulator [Ruminococcus sp.]